MISFWISIMSLSLSSLFSDNSAPYFWHSWCPRRRLFLKIVVISGCFLFFIYFFSSLSYIFDTLNTINETANLAILYQTDHSDSARKVSWIRIFERTNQQFNFAESSKIFLTIWKWKALNALSTKQFPTNHCSFALFWMINDQYCSWPIIVGFL